MKLEKKLASTIEKYIQRQSVKRPALGATLNAVSEKLPETVIFGGMLREFSLGNAKNFASDIDLVSLASSKEIFHAIKQFDPIKNKFGGYRFYVEKQLYDLWALEDTWAFKEGLVKGQSFTDLFKTTFFNLDSAFFHLTNENCFLSEKYEDWCNNSLLELNLEENPSPASMTKRALKLIFNKNLAVGPKLAQFLTKHHRFYFNSDLSAGLFFSGLKQHMRSMPEKNFFFNPQQPLFTHSLASQEPPEVHYEYSV